MVLALCVVAGEGGWDGVVCDAGSDVSNGVRTSLLLVWDPDSGRWCCCISGLSEIDTDARLGPIAGVMCVCDDDLVGGLECRRTRRSQAERLTLTLSLGLLLALLELGPLWQPAPSPDVLLETALAPIATASVFSSLALGDRLLKKPMALLPEC